MLGNKGLNCWYQALDIVFASKEELLVNKSSMEINKQIHLVKLHCENIVKSGDHSTTDAESELGKMAILWLPITFHWWL